MLKVGITGQAGFIGTHLFNYLSLKTNDITMIPFEDAYFQDQKILENWVVKCDVIIHLAALNRHENKDVLYETNIDLVRRLIGTLNNTGSKPHIIFSSSSQESKENEYGKSKKEGRRLFSEWALQNNARFTGLVIPNVFGPFGLPFYNSVIATFCYQLTHSEVPKIDVDGNLKLIYVGELAELIFGIIRKGTTSDQYEVLHSSEKKVSEILELLNRFKASYFDAGIFPKLNSQFEINLFNTFRSFFDTKNRYPIYLNTNSDSRGYFVELAKSEVGGQISFSSTYEGITRGNHFHTRKIERFAVIRGEALIQLRQIGKTEVLNFYLSGEKPSYVDMPVWFTHNIKNIGKEELLTVFWINEFYNEADPDTFFEVV